MATNDDLSHTQLSKEGSTFLGENELILISNEDALISCDWIATAKSSRKAERGHRILLMEKKKRRC